jgi:hypothetical protein
MCYGDTWEHFVCGVGGVCVVGGGGKLKKHLAEKGEKDASQGVT